MVMARCSGRQAWRAAVVVALCGPAMCARPASSQVPLGNPLARYNLPWTREIKWGNVARIQQFPGDTWEARLAAAQTALSGQGGGVVFFPAGTYQFKESLHLKDGIVLRGADPVGVTAARQDQYDPPAKFEFPRYMPRFEGDGTPNDTAFKGIFVEDPATTSHCGLVHIAINYGHIAFGDGAEHKAGRDRFVYGCVLRNAATAEPAVPDLTIGQHPWQRFPRWHGGEAIGVYSAENCLIANNRLPQSDANFLMKDYVLQGRGRTAGKVVPPDGVWFDYDDRPGITANAYGIGGPGGAGPDGTPETYPWGFRKGTVVRDNYIYSTGRTAIEFTGDGTVCSFNVIRFKPEVVQWTNTGRGVVSGSSTNDNRAVTMRGWRWVVEGNDYEVYKNRAADTPYYINDGEGLMHEDHVNSTVLDSKLINNKGNSYLSIYLTGGINGLLVQGNDIRTSGGISAIYVVANRSAGRGKWTPFECRNVQILGNTTAGSGIEIGGAPAENNLIKGNRHIGERGKIINGANARVEDNQGYDIEERH